VHLLWIKTELLHPIDKGGRIRTYNMLRALKRQHRVTYLTLDNGSAAPDAAELAQEYCHELVRVPFHEAKRLSPRFWLEPLANVASPLPYAIAKYKSDRLRKEIQDAVRDRGIDVVVCDFLAPSQNVPDGLPCRTVLFQHNVEAAIWRRHAYVRANPLSRAYLREQWRRMERFERNECRRFDRVVAVSRTDAIAIERDYGSPASPTSPPALTPKLSDSIGARPSNLTAWCSPARWTGSQRGRDRMVRVRGPSPHPRADAGRDTHDCWEKPAAGDSGARRA
jgi:hypothetical protein